MPAHASHKRGVKYSTLFYGLPYVTRLFVTEGRQLKSVPYSAPRLRYRFRFRNERKAMFSLGSILKRGGSGSPTIRGPFSKTKSIIFENGPLEASVLLHIAVESGIRSHGFIPTLALRPAACAVSIRSSVRLQRGVLVVVSVLLPLNR